MELRYLGRQVDPRVFASTAPALELFEELAGVPYPGDRYTQALVPIRSGQELAGMALLSERYAESVLRDPKEDWLVVHELAHQWWGNLVTCASWQDFWMNEALATFMTAVFKERHWGRDAYEREVRLARERYARLRAEGRDRPLAPAGDLGPDDVGGPIPYTKGMLFLHLLRERLGDDAFFAALREFTRKNAGKSVTTQAFRQAFGQAPLFEDHVFGTRPLPASGSGAAPR